MIVYGDAMTNRMTKSDDFVILILTFYDYRIDHDHSNVDDHDVDHVSLIGDDVDQMTICDDIDHVSGIDHDIDLLNHVVAYRLAYSF